MSAAAWPFHRLAVTCHTSTLPLPMAQATCTALAPMFCLRVADGLMYPGVKTRLRAANTTTGGVGPKLPSVVHLKRLAVDHRVNISLAVDTVGTTMKKEAELLNSFESQDTAPLRSTSVTMGFSPRKPLLDVRGQIRLLVQRPEVDPTGPKCAAQSFDTALELQVFLHHLDSDLLAA